MIIEWDLEINVKVNGASKKLVELLPDVLGDLVNEILADGLKDKAYGEFKHTGE